MTTVPAGYGSWLMAEARYASTNIAGVTTKWADKALTSSLISPLAYQADAQAEATRQAQFLSGPTVQDEIVVKGLRRDLIGSTVFIQGGRLGYDAAPACYVIDADENGSGQTTTLTIIRPL